ncbi:MAG: hypothetical protein Q9162_002076 [Coniocarpon cinnabarinum]
MTRRPPRRRPSSYAPADFKKTQGDVAFDIDVLILDYLVHQALKAVLSSKHAESLSPTDHDFRPYLFQVDRYLKHISARHHHGLAGHLRFSLSLLRFCTLLHEACHPSSTASTAPSATLIELRSRNRTRAARWWIRRRQHYSQSATSSFSSSQSQEDAADALAHTLQSLALKSHVQQTHDGQADDPPPPETEVIDLESPPDPAPQQNEHSSRDQSASTDNSNEGPYPSLLDLLPLFVQLTHERALLISHDSVTSEMWLGLVVEMMIQAFLEQRVVFEEEGVCSLLEAFAWGPVSSVKGGVEVGNDGNQDLRIHDVFLLQADSSRSSALSNGSQYSNNAAEDRLTADTFQYYRDRALSSLDPTTYLSSDPQALYRSLLGPDAPLDPHPRDAFEKSMWGFLDAVAKSVDVPVLVQLEQVQKGRRTRVDLRDHRLGSGETEILREIWEAGLGQHERKQSTGTRRNSKEKS